MTQEEKELLLKDLCARLPYRVKVKHAAQDFSSTLEWIDSYRLSAGIKADKIGVGSGWYSIEFIKPYLRPMSSMTEEEKQMMDNLWKDNNKLVFADPDEVRRYRFYDISVVDFLNSRHFDYRGLIEKGLALEAPEGMYD